MAKKGKQVLNDYYVRKLWENLRQSTALTSLSAFAKARNNVDNLKELERTLSKIPSYSRHRRLLKNFKKPAIILHETGRAYSSDLADFQSLSRFNSGYRFLLVTIDMFSKRLSIVPLKRKTAQETTKGLETAMKQLKYTPLTWTSDMGTELKNSLSKAFFKKHGITQYFMKTERKASLAEIAIKYIKIKIYKYFTMHSTKRYVDIIPHLVNTYNNTPHSSHGYMPSKVNRKNQDEVFSSLYKRLVIEKRPPPAYSTGDTVRLAERRYNFQKFYKPNYSEQLFTIAEIKDTFPVHTYRIKSLDNRLVESSFCKEELSRA